MDNLTWFETLNKPLFAPPNWVFTPVWTVLYILMGIAFVIYLRGYERNKSVGVMYFFVQLILNLLWPSVFFGNMDIKGGLIIVALLVIFVALTVYEFYKKSKLSAVLLLPYLFWVLFATYLNYQYYVLNN